MSETNQARVGAGNIAVRLDGKDLELVPTYAAAQGISRLSGGLRGAIEGVSKLDIDVIARVVQFGLGPRVVKDLGGAQKLPEMIFAAGMTDSTGEFAGKCIEYIGVLSNGGRPMIAADEGDDSNPQ